MYATASNRSRETVKQPRGKRKALLAVATATLLAAGLAASPAYAAGSFNVKVTPSGCTQTDFSGYSQATSTGAKGLSQHNAIICSQNILTSVTVARGGNSATNGSYTSGTASVLLTGSPSGSVAGAHILGNYSRSS